MEVRRFLVVVVLVGAVGTPATAAAGATTATAAHEATTVTRSTSASTTIAGAGVNLSDGDIHQRKLLELTPATPGEIRTTLRYRIPDNVRSLNVTLPAGASVRRADGFRRTTARSYEWDGVTASPSIVFDLAANQTFEGGRAPPEPGAGRPVRATEGYSFVDTGKWALVQVPSMALSWRYVGTRPVRLATTAAVDGDGSTGGEIAYLGPMTLHTREANGQTFRLVVPAAASLRSSPRAVLDALAGASGRLVVGDRDPEVFVVAAPTSVDWGPRGIEYGGSDAWVRADEPLDQATNVWLHEYVHTRQAFDTTTATAWLAEGTADYYAALLALRQGLIGFDAFRDRLRRGTRDPYASAVLAEPSTWNGVANYLKGSLVFGTLDREIRLAGDRSADAVFARLNADDDRVTQSEFLAAVEAAGDASVRRTARRYTETSDAPSMWSRSEHDRAFPSTELLSYGLDEATLDVAGPYRNRTVAADETLVTGEMLRLAVPVRNVGDQRTRYAVAVEREGTVVAHTEGTLAPGESTTATLTVPLRTAGNYTVSAGANAVPIRVREPATVRVRQLSVSPVRVAVGDEATVRITVANPSTRPAVGTVELTADGDSLARHRVTLDAEATTTLTYAVGFETPGARTLRAGDASTTLIVEPPSTPTPEPTPTPNPTGQPAGLSWMTMVLGLALAVLLLGRR